MSGVVRQESSASTVGSAAGGKPRSRTGSQSSVHFESGRRRSSSSRRNSKSGRMRGAAKPGRPGAGGPNQPPVVVDEFNNVVTPKPLSKSVNPLSTGATPLDEHLMKEFTMPAASAPSPRATTPMSDMGSEGGWGEPPGDKQKRSRGTPSGRSTPSTNSEVGELVPATPGIDALSTIVDEPTPGTISEEAGSPRASKKPSSPRTHAALTKHELEEHVTTTLSETATFFLLDITGTCVALDSEDAAGITEENTKYDELLVAKQGSDSYVSQSVQTLPSFPKNKEVLVQPPATAESGTMATNWDIYDAFNPPDSGTDADGVAAPKLPKPSIVLPIDPALELAAEAEAEAAAAPEPEAEAGAEGEPEGEPEAEPEEEPAPDVSHLDSLPETLKTVERMLTQNIFHDKHLEYRNYRSAQLIAAEAQKVEAEDDGNPKLEKLWTFQCEFTDGRNVSAMSWNKEDKDLVAASYGEFDFSVEQNDGAVALWSLKNPTHPERVYSLPCGVTSIDWSSYYPFLLAVGLYDGNVAIYDVRSEDNEPILQSGNNTEKHHDPVWQVSWIDKGMERGECLVSISTDGRVKEWRIKKGLEHQELMMMKETPRGDKDSGGEQNLISHFASGMCFDFSPLDPQQYLAGTESGNIHKCSCSYNESYLQDFTGHEPGMPVYKIRWSPFAPNIFLSCSEDWTVKLWKDDNSGSTAPSKPLLSFTSSNDYVGDIRWAPTYSTVFGSVTGDGKLDIWDVEREILNPVISHPSGHTRLSTLLFAEGSPVVITGADDGQIDVYRLTNLEGGSLTDIEQATNLEHAIQKNLE